MAALNILASDIDEYIESSKKVLKYDFSAAFTPWEKEVISRCCEDCGFEVKDEKSFWQAESASRIKNPDSGQARVTKKTEYNLVFVVHGPYTVSSSAIFHTQSGQFKIQALIFHESYAKKRYEQIAKLLVKNESVVMPPGSDEEYLTEMLRDAEEVIRWEKAAALAPGASIWDIKFDERGHFVRSELDVVPL